MLRKQNRLHIALEIVTIFSFIVIGVTMLTFMSQEVEISKSYVGSLVLAIGVTELVSFLSMKDLVKLRNIPNAVVAFLSMVLGVILLVLNIDLATTCIVWSIANLAFLVGKVIDSGFNILRQPFLNIIVIILCIVETIFTIFLLANPASERALNNQINYIGIALCIKSAILIIEFIIHRYQKI